MDDGVFRVGINAYTLRKAKWQQSFTCLSIFRHVTREGGERAEEKGAHLESNMQKTCVGLAYFAERFGSKKNNCFGR